jgi:AraC-like DNA-binding protein
MTPRETTVAASVVGDMINYLSARGVRSSEAITAAGLDPAFAASPDSRVRGSQVERLWSYAVEQTGDAVVGLHMAEEYNPGALDILGYVVLSCRTIGEVLEKLARYVPLLNDGMRMELSRDARSAVLRISYVEGIDNYLLRAPEHAIDATWGGLARELRRLAGTPLHASSVAFRHPAPPSAAARAEYARILGAPVSFSAAEDRFTIPIAHLAMPLPSAHATLLQVFEQHAQGALNAIGESDTTASQVARVVSQKLKGSLPVLDEVARELSMSRRNLQRSLRESGTSYQALLDEVRHDLAVRHLANPTTSTGQVGFLLGFSEPSAFHRAFKRWTGKSPSAYRMASAT